MKWLAKVEFYDKCFEQRSKTGQRVLHWSWSTANDYLKKTTYKQTTKNPCIFMESLRMHHVQSLETKKQIPFHNFST